MKNMVFRIAVCLMAALALSCSNLADGSDEGSVALSGAMGRSAASGSSYYTAVLQAFDGSQYSKTSRSALSSSALADGFNLSLGSLEVGRTVRVSLDIYDASGTHLFTGTSDSFVVRSGENAVSLALTSVVVAADYYVNAEDGNDSNGGASEGDAFKTLEKAVKKAIMDAGEGVKKISLLSDVTVAETIDNGACELSIYLNGHTVKRADEFQSILFDSTSMLALYNGTVDGEDVSAVDPLFRNKSTLQLTKVTITGASVQKNASAIWMDDGVLRLVGTTITDCEAEYCAPVVIVSGYAVLDGARIQENEGLVSAVAMNNGTLVLTGGTSITGDGEEGNKWDWGGHTIADPSTIANVNGTVVLCGASIVGNLYNGGTTALVSSYTHSDSDTAETFTGAANTITDESCALYAFSGTVIVDNSATISGGLYLIAPSAKIGVATDSFTHRPIARVASLDSSVAAAFTGTDSSVGKTLYPISTEQANIYFPLSNKTSWSD